MWLGFFIRLSNKFKSCGNLSAIQVNTIRREAGEGQENIWPPLLLTRLLGRALANEVNLLGVSTTRKSTAQHNTKRHEKVAYNLHVQCLRKKFTLSQEKVCGRRFVTVK